MISGRDIIIFGDDWGHYVSTIQHIGKILAEQNRIIWVGSIGLRRPEVSLYDIKRVATKVMKMSRRRPPSARTVQSVRQVFPFVIPYHDIEAVYRYNMQNIRASLREAMAQEHFVDPIVISANPIVGDLIGTLGERSSYYLCLDDWTKFDGAFRSIDEREQSLLAKVTGAFSISETLLQSRRPVSGKNELLPQGVDAEHFAVADGEARPIPGVTQGPVIGFFGMLASWVDVDLIGYCAEHLPSYTFVVMGKQNTDISIFSRYPNILYAGEVPYDTLPYYAKSFDVGLIPFRINPLTIASNPIKLMEYLSLGLPVVSTELPEVQKHGDLVRVAGTYAGFAAAIVQAVEERAEGKADERRARACSYSWRAVTERMSDRILAWESNQ
jgi:glycosyltransferase involved in cell wall biosynthesis